MQRLKAKRRRPVFTPFTSNPPAAAFLQNIITQSNLQKANLHFWDHPCPNSSWFIQEKLWKISHQKNWWTFTKKNTKPFLKRERERYFFPQDFLWRRRAEWFLMRIWYFIIWAAWWDFSPRSIEILLWDHSDPLWGLSTPSRRYKRPFHPFHFHFSLFTFHFSLSLFHTVAQIQTPFPSKINSKNNLRTTLLEKKTLEWRARPERKDVSIHSISIQINLIDIDEVKMWNSKFFQNLSFARWRRKLIKNSNHTLKTFRS